MLKRIRISNYKSLSDLDVTLQPLTVLCGPNAAGKSNFLDALQLLSRLATSRSLKEAFEPPYRGNPLESFTFSGGGLADLLKQSTCKFQFEADLELSKSVIEAVDKEIGEFRRSASSTTTDEEQKSYIQERFVRYRIIVEILPQTGILRVADESLSALRSDGEIKKGRRPFLERIKNRLHLRMERQAHPMEFERGLDHTILSRPLYAPHYPHLVATKYELASWLFFYFEPRERMRSANPVREVKHIGLMGEELAGFLNTLKTVRPPQYHAIEQALRQIVPQVKGIRTVVNQFGEVELQVVEDTVSIPARLLSEGTLRVLGLLAAGSMPSPPALIGLEEPENGVHPRRIELIAEYLRTHARRGASQLIVTTHSPTLLDQLPLESLFVVNRTNRSTGIKPLETWGPLGRSSSVSAALAEENGGLRVSDRILAGELDA